MGKGRFNFPVQGNYIRGEFKKPSDVNGEWISRSPGDFSDELGKFSYSYRAVDEAVQAARSAFESWRHLALADRAAFLKRYQAALKKREEELTEIIAREVGKPLWESKTEFTAMTNKVDVTITESMKYVADFEIPKIMEGTHGACHYRPLGVMAVIGPFNFPGHLPNGHIVPARLTGNTVIFKPSEKSPMVGQLMADCFHEAGFPKGVFNLLQGEREVGRRLVVHEEIDAILFTGSYEVGTRIKQDTLQQHWKLLALEMGGKNASIVWNDVDLDFAVHETLTAAFMTAGQRCSATSRVIIHNSMLDAFVSRFHEKSKAFSIGNPLENPFMGPLIEQGSVDRYMKFQGIASREGAELVMRGKALDVGFQGNYVTPSICLIPKPTLEATKKSVYQQTELFAPNVSILGVSELEEAIAFTNATQYGLVASVFSKSKTVYEKCLDQIHCGLVNWNKTTVGASSRLPFGGIKKSGNHFPTALFATRYCMYPIASLEVAEPQPVKEGGGYPGMNWG